MLCRRSIAFAGFLLCLWWELCAPPRVLAAAETQASFWNGEHLGKRQGAFYVALRLNGFQASRQAIPLTGDVKITMTNMLTKKLYSFSYPLRSLSGSTPYWKLGSGKYTLKALELIDAAGKKRIWANGKARDVIVKRQMVSNFGLWTIRPSGPTGLAIKQEMVPNTYTESSSKDQSRIVAVINGFNGLIQEAFGGKRVLRQAEQDFGNRRELRATAAYTRQIAMFYQLNLFKHNHRAKEIANILGVSDNSVRTCYTDRLDTNEGLRGNVTLKFIMSKSTGTMRKLTHVGGTANDPGLIRCMVLVLSQISFPVAESMLGELTYTFDVK